VGPFAGHTFCQFSPDGTQVASGSWDETVRICDARTGHVIAGPFEGHTDSVNSVAFSPDGTRVASASEDKKIRIWDARCLELYTDQISLIGGQCTLGCFRQHTEQAEIHRGWACSPGSARPIIRFWVPSLCRQGLCSIETLMIFGVHTAQMDLSRSVHGTSWTQCYSCVSLQLSLFHPLICVTLRQPPESSSFPVNDPIARG
jgi:WD40 repeat protein